jgi:peptidyl-tRNA hydrolase, PTH1 family
LWAVVGLGNPGNEYAHTRHNAGFLFVRKLAKAWNVRLDRRRFRSRIAELERDEGTVMLVLPQTYMNDSGRAVGALLRSKRIPPERMVVVYDDLDLPLGRLRVRKEGSPGTHRGLRSIVQEIETNAFPRIRLGIGPLPERADAADYVLSEFEPQEREIFEQSLDRARQALELVLAGEIAKAMNRYN